MRYAYLLAVLALSACSQPYVKRTDVFLHADAEAVEVVSVIDGDTLRVRTASGTVESVRMIGIDTPEIDWNKGTADCFGFEAREKLYLLLADRSVTVLRQPVGDRDKYGRLLRYVESGKADIGSMMLEEGFARNYPWFLHPRLDVYAAVAKEAEVQRRGLWDVCEE